MKTSRGRLLLILGVVLVVIDQTIKVLVKTSMTIGESYSVIGDWFRILFIENEGMAFGMKFGGMAGKFVLTLFRLVLFGFLCWWINRLNTMGRKITAYMKDSGNKAEPIWERVPTGVLVGLTLISAGAFGNILDCLFYGRIFSESTPFEVAQLGGNYAPVMFGKVVDMFYFPLIDTTWPDWIPVIGGKAFRFFEPVFNFADSCVTVGALYLIIFQYRFFSSEGEQESHRKQKTT